MIVPKSFKIENPNIGVNVWWQSRKYVVSEEHNVLTMKNLRKVTKLPLSTL